MIRRSHGATYPEVATVDELPAGVPDAPRVESPTDRGPGGRFAPGNSLAGLAGKARKGKTRLADRLGLRAIPDAAAFRPYKAAAASFRRAQCAELAKTVGGGVCGPAPSSLVASAALQLAWSRYLADLAASENDPDLALKASKLSDASRQNLLAAHELCALEARARAASPTASLPPWLLAPAQGGGGGTP
jgi:hypothetical protein